MNTRYRETMHNDQRIADLVDRPMDKALISKRPGGGGASQAYVKGDVLSDQLNVVFGPLGWSKSSTIHSVDDWQDEKTVTRNNAPTKVAMTMVQVIANVTLTIKKITADGTDTVFTEQGIGYGEVEAGKSRKDAFGMAVKGASTDGLKRAANHLGKAFGMMMASSGNQEDVEYAHNGKANDLRAAREMRKRAERGDDDARQERPNGDRDRGDAGGREQRRNAPSNRDDRGGRDQRDDRAQRDDRGQRDDRDHRSGAQADRDADRGQDRRREPTAERTDAGRGEGSAGDRHDQRPAQSEDAKGEAPGDKGTDAGRTSTRTAGGEAAGDGAKGAPKRAVNTDYELDNLPVTKDEQTDFAATLATRVKELRQPADREGLVRQHLMTIRNLETKLRTHLVGKLREHGVDVDQMRS